MKNSLGSIRTIPALLAAALLCACTSQEGNIVFSAAGLVNDPDSQSQQLRFSLDVQMSEAVLEALHHGVPLTFVVQAQAVVPREWWLDQQLNTLTTELNLSWRPMTKQYVVEVPSTGQHFLVSERETAARALNGPFLIPLPPTELGAQGRWQVQAELNLDALPSPLRLPAWFTSDWHMSSAWYAAGPS